MAPDNHEWLTPRQVADRLKVNEDVVRRWLRDGRLRGSFIGRVWRVGDGDLAAFMDAHVPAAGAELPAEADER